MHIIDLALGKTPGRKRSRRWPAVRAKFLLSNPVCAACGGTASLEVHHIIPFHERPDLEEDPNNLITLCTSKKYGINCHLALGHKGGYTYINPDVRETSKMCKKYLESRKDGTKET